MAAYSYSCVIVGAGVVGLAIARELALRGMEVLVLEAAGCIGSHTSSRNSEVIHAGLYYPVGSLKAQMCVAGKERLYRYCQERGVPHRRCGKLIVAVDETQLGALEEIQAQARSNGVDDLVWLDQTQVRALEPEVRAVAGLLSPSTGILDSHQLLLSLQGEAEAAGALVVLNAPVESGGLNERGVLLEVGGQSPTRLQARYLINAAGLWAPQLASRLQGFPRQQVPRAWFAKGHYFSLSSRSPFQRLVYPIPEPGGLGVHLTLDLAGQARFGPDVEWVEGIDYQMDDSRAEQFYGAIRRYWPKLPDGALQPAYAGIRPKLSGPGEPAADFMIQSVQQHGIPGLVNLFGIESPGLTSCLALAREVADRLEE